MSNQTDSKMSKEPIYARDLIAGHVLTLWRQGAMRKLTIEKVTNLSNSTIIYYAGEKTPDLVRPWDLFSPQNIK